MDIDIFRYYFQANGKILSAGCNHGNMFQPDMYITNAKLIPIKNDPFFFHYLYYKMLAIRS